MKTLHSLNYAFECCKHGIQATNTLLPINIFFIRAFCESKQNCVCINLSESSDSNNACLQNWWSGQLKKNEDKNVIMSDHLWLIALLLWGGQKKQMCFAVWLLLSLSLVPVLFYIFSSRAQQVAVWFKNTPVFDCEGLENISLQSVDLKWHLLNKTSCVKCQHLISQCTVALAQFSWNISLQAHKKTSHLKKKVYFLKADEISVFSAISFFYATQEKFYL